MVNLTMSDLPETSSKISPLKIGKVSAAAAFGYQFFSSSHWKFVQGFSLALTLCFLNLPTSAQDQYRKTLGFIPPFKGNPVSAKWSDSGEILAYADYKFSSGGLKSALVTASGSVRKFFPEILNKIPMRYIWIEPDGKMLIRNPGTFDIELISFFDGISGGIIRIDTDGEKEDSFVNFFGETRILGRTIDGKYLVRYRRNGYGHVAKLLADGTPDPTHRIFRFNENSDDNNASLIIPVSVAPDGSFLYSEAEEPSDFFLHRIDSNGFYDDKFGSPEISKSGDVVFWTTNDAVFLQAQYLTVGGISKPAGAKLSMDGSLDLSYIPETQMASHGIFEFTLPNGDIYSKDGSCFLLADKTRYELYPNPAGFVFKISPDGILDPVSLSEEWQKARLWASNTGELLVSGTIYNPTTVAFDQHLYWYTNKPIPYSSPFQEIVSFSKEPVSLDVETSKNGALTFQWLKDAQPISGETDNEITFPRLDASNAGQYQLEIRSDSEVIVTEAITLLEPKFPNIKRAPSYVNGGVGEDVTIIASVEGVPLPRVEWYRNGNLVRYASGQTVVLPNVDENSSGMYHIKAINEVGESVSKPFPLEVFGYYSKPLELPGFFESRSTYLSPGGYFVPAQFGSFWKSSGYGLGLYNLSGDSSSGFIDLLDRDGPYQTEFVPAPDGSFFAYWRGISENGSFVYNIQKIAPQGVLDSQFSKVTLNSEIDSHSFTPLGDGGCLVRDGGVWKKYDSSGRMDETFNSPNGEFQIEPRNDSKGSSGTFFMYEYDRDLRETYLLRFNLDGTRDESFPPFNRRAAGQSFEAFWPDGRILLMNSTTRMLRLRNKDGTIEWEMQLGGGYPISFSHPLIHGNERVFILQKVEDPPDAREVRWISSDGTNNFDSPILLENVGEAFYLTLVTDNVIVIQGSKRSGVSNQIIQARFVFYDFQSQSSYSHVEYAFGQLNYFDEGAVGSEGSLFFAGEFSKVGDHLRDRLVRLVEDSEFRVDPSFNPNSTLEAFQGKVEGLYPVEEGGIIVKVNDPRPHVHPRANYNSLVYLNSSGNLKYAVSPEEGFEITSFALLQDGSLVYGLRDVSNEAFSLQKTTPSGEKDAAFFPPQPTGRIYEIYASDSGGAYVSMHLENGSDTSPRKVLQIDSGGVVLKELSVDSDTELSNIYISPSYEIWARIRNLTYKIVKFDSEGKVAAGFPHVLPHQFSLANLEFLSDGTALLIGNGFYDAYTINPDGTLNNTVFQGAFDYARGIIGLDGDRILQKSQGYPQLINRYSFQAVPIIQQQPTKAFGTIGKSTVFNTSVFGDHPVHYQWLRNGEEIEGATNDTLLLSDLEVRDEDLYSVQITLGNVTVLSQPAKLTVVELEGFPTKEAPLSLETNQGDSVVRWKTDSAYNYYVETSIDLSEWVRDDRPVFEDEGEASVFFESSEINPRLFVRVISEINSN